MKVYGWNRTVQISGRVKSSSWQRVAWTAMQAASVSKFLDVQTLDPIYGTPWILSWTLHAWLMQESMHWEAQILLLKVLWEILTFYCMIIRELNCHTTCTYTSFLGELMPWKFSGQIFITCTIGKRQSGNKSYDTGETLCSVLIPLYMFWSGKNHDQTKLALEGTICFWSIDAMEPSTEAMHWEQSSLAGLVRLIYG